MIDNGKRLYTIFHYYFITKAKVYTFVVSNQQEDNRERKLGRKVKTQRKTGRKEAKGVGKNTIDHIPLSFHIPISTNKLTYSYYIIQ